MSLCPRLDSSRPALTVVIPYNLPAEGEVVGRLAEVRVQRVRGDEALREPPCPAQPRH